MSKIEASSKTIDNIFNSTYYEIPYNQRDFSWQTGADGEINRLILSLIEAYKSDDRAEGYFIGSMIFSKSDTSDRLIVIDGQQRLTTLFLILCCLYRHISEISPHNEDLDVCEKYIFTKILRDTTQFPGETRYVKIPRLKVHYRGGNGVLEELVSAGKPIASLAMTPEAEDLYAAYYFIKNIITEEFENDVQDAFAFHEFIRAKVELVKITTDTTVNALQIFENINDLGRKLSSADLVKNLLFKKTNSRKEEAALQDRWCTFTGRLRQGNGKFSITRFLKFFIYADHATEEVPETAVFRWFDSPASEALLEKPLELVQKLDDAAKAYLNFISSKDVHGNPNRFLENLKFVKNGYIFFVFAARRFPLELFNKLCSALEKYLFVLNLANPSSQAPEVRLMPFVIKLRDIDSTSEAVDLYISNTFELELSRLRGDFEQRMLHLSEDNFKVRHGIKYILAKMAQEIETRANGLNSRTSCLDTYMDKSLTIEHILCQAAANDATSKALIAFGDVPDISTYIHSLGNLTLLSRSANSSVQDKPYSEKKAAYAQEQLYFTKAIAETIEVGKNTAINRACSAIYKIDELSPASLEKRQRSLTNLALEIWGPPGRVVG